ncbi:MAG: hypothetical protein RBS43_01925 [Candidatus Cloacimonas sp.]|jgi:hypothetical protein|nr:hypothetical protein [Candidatus Cloacimonas sp.]
MKIEGMEPVEILQKLIELKPTDYCKQPKQWAIDLCKSMGIKLQVN